LQLAGFDAPREHHVGALIRGGLVALQQEARAELLLLAVGLRFPDRLRVALLRGGGEHRRQLAGRVDHRASTIAQVDLLPNQELESDPTAHQNGHDQQADQESLGAHGLQVFRAQDRHDLLHARAPCSAASAPAMRMKMSCSDGLVCSK
jgi:hypothetical protein